MADLKRNFDVLKYGFDQTKSPKFVAIRGSGRILGKYKIMHLICYAEAKMTKMPKIWSTNTSSV